MDPYNNLDTDAKADPIDTPRDLHNEHDAHSSLKFTAELVRAQHNAMVRMTSGDKT